MENIGHRGWYPAKGEHAAEVRLLIETVGQPIQEAVLTRDVQPHCRYRFVFGLTASVVEAGVGIFRGQ